MQADVIYEDVLPGGNHSKPGDTVTLRFEMPTLVVLHTNFSMNVPISPEGGLTFEDGISAPGKYVELIAEMDILVLISNCPQLNNPCSGYNPTPIELAVWRQAG